jgi:O-antigen/teichoic acid export membrane protein
MQTVSVPSLKKLIPRIRAVTNIVRLRLLLTRRSTDAGRERYRRASLTASASFVSKALTLTISLVSVPLTIHYLGPERYGVWLTIGSLLTWMALTDFGLAGNALVNVLSDADGKDDRELARQYASSAFWTLSAVSAVVGTALFFLFGSIPWRAVFHVSAAVSRSELDQACAWALVFFVLGFPLSLLTSIYNAYQDGAVGNMWMIGSNLAALVALVIVTRFHGGLPALVLAIAGTRMVIAIANFYTAFFRRYRWLAPSPAAVRLDRVKELLSLGSKYMVTQLASLGIYQSQPMIITQILGPSYVVIFLVAQKLITLPNDLVYIGTAPFISAYGEGKARGDWHWIKGAFKNSLVASVIFGVPLTIGIAAFAKPAIRIWAGAAVVPDTPVILALAGYTLICVFMLPVGQFLVGLGRADILASSLGLCAIATIGSGIVLARPWGLTGVAVAMAVSKISTSSPIQLYRVRTILRSFSGKRRDINPRAREQEAG